MALRLLPISERSYVTRRELFALARPYFPVFLAHEHTYERTYVSSSIFPSISSSSSLSDLTTKLTHVLGTHGVMYVSVRISDSLYLYRNDFFFFLVLPALSIKRKRTHFSPSSLSRVRHPCPTKPSSYRDSHFISLSLFRLFFSLLLALRFTLSLSNSLRYYRIRSYTILFPLFPPSPPFRSLVLISVLGRRACTHAAYLRRSPAYIRELSLSLSRAMTNTDIACACERCGEKQGG